MSSTRRLTLGLVLSGVGHLLHNVQEFGIAILDAWETILPVVITATLIVAVQRQTTKRMLLVVSAWGMVVLVAGGGSVLPLSALPFEPEQTVAHYATHAAYALLQVPLFAATAMTLAQLRRRHQQALPGPSHPDVASQ